MCFHTGFNWLSGTNDQPPVILLMFGAIWDVVLKLTSIAGPMSASWYNSFIFYLNKTEIALYTCCAWITCVHKTCSLDRMRVLQSKCCNLSCDRTLDRHIEWDLMDSRWTFVKEITKSLAESKQCFKTKPGVILVTCYSAQTTSISHYSLWKDWLCEIRDNIYTLCFIICLFAYHVKFSVQSCTQLWH